MNYDAKGISEYFQKVLGKYKIYIGYKSNNDCKECFSELNIITDAKEISAQVIPMAQNKPYLQKRIANHKNCSSIQ